MIPSYGTSGDDTLGDDGVNYAYVADAMTGYAGDDIYHIDNYMDTAVEAANGGNDTVILDSDYIFNPKTMGYSAPKNIENMDIRGYSLPDFFQYLVNMNVGFTQEYKSMALDYLRSNRASMSANASDNTIYASDNSGDYIKILGLGGNDTILGSIANDYLDGGAGNDVLLGEAGNDTLFGGAGNDNLEDWEGVNILDGGAGNDAYWIGPNIDNTTIKDSGGRDLIIISGNNNIYSLMGTSIEDLDGSGISTSGNVLEGNNLDNSIMGGAYSNTLYGFNGNDTLDGGDDSFGDDLIGGSGNDTYIIRDLSDYIEEDANGGIDTIKLLSGISYIDTGDENYENIEYINGTESETSMSIIGNGLANVIAGGSANDVLNGGIDSKCDTLFGGEGSDDYLIYDTKDIIVENGTNKDDVDSIVIDNYYDDNAKTPDSATLILNNANIESIIAGWVEDRDLIIRGNLKTSTTIRGGLRNNYITCGSVNDVIFTNDGNDYIDGGAGSDVISGYGSNDTLYGGNDNVSDDIQGGTGNDTYLVQDTKDLITDEEGTADTIKLMATFDNDANARTAAKYDVTNAGIETIDASLMSKSIIINGSDSINATLKGGSGADTIIGGASNETIFGGKGNDTISGGGGTNELNGDDGNDTFLFDTELIGNSIYGGSGTDTIKLVVDSDGKLGGALSGAISLEVTTEVENIDASAITSTELTLVGNELKNKIAGTVLADIIDGGTGADTLIGGKGNDIYTVDNCLDVITEAANTKVVTNTGIDTIKFAPHVEFGKSISYNIAANVENLDLREWELDATQKTALTKTKLTINANASDNTIYANDTDGAYLKILAGAGNDTIYGGKGNNYIDGGAGDDIIYGGEGDLINNITSYNSNNKLQSKANYIYDSTGNKTAEVNELYDTSGNLTSKSTYSCDKNGKILKANCLNYDTSGNLTYEQTKTFDTRGNILTDNYKYYDPTGKINYLQNATNTYDAKGNLLSAGRKEYDESNTLVYQEDSIYTYNAKGSQLSLDYKDYHSGVLTTHQAYVYTYDSANNILSIDFNKYDSTGKLVSNQPWRASYTYDSHGNKITSNYKQYDASGTLTSEIPGTDAYTYDSNGKMLTSDTKQFNSNVVTYQSVKTYDSSGNVLTENISGTNTVNTGKYTYSYDEGGNVLIKDYERHLSGVFTSRTKETYTYDSSGNKLTYMLQQYDSSNTLRSQESQTFDINGFVSTDDSRLYDSSGHITSQTKSTYDLLSESIPTSQFVTSFEMYNFDSSGNIISQSTSISSVNTYTSTSKMLIGGTGNDTYIIDSANDIIKETSGAGTDTIKLNGDFTGGGLSLANYANIENIDGSLISSDLELSGNALNNVIYGGAGNDTLYGGKGNDTLTGGDGADTYSFDNGSAKDTITSTDSLDKLHFNQGAGLDKNDFLFYSDIAGNLFVDYSNDAVGKDIIKLTAGNYDDSTNIELQSGETISINSISQYLASSGSAYSGLSAAEIQAINTANVSEQAGALALTWTAA